MEFDTCPGRWRCAYVFRKERGQTLDRCRAQNYYDLLVANSTDAIDEVLHRGEWGYKDGHVSFREIRILMGQHTCVYEDFDGKLIDVHADFMKHAISEQWLYLMISRYGRIQYTPYPYSFRKRRRKN